MYTSTLLALLSSPLLLLAAPIVAPVSANPARRSIPGYMTSCATGTALTFDDGPYTYQQTLLDELQAAGAKATFFVNGNNWGCIYDEAHVASLRRAYEAGHTIGSHTWSHDNIANNGIEHLGTSLDLVETALWKILGVKPALFRPPFGSYSAETLSYLNSRGYTVAGWNADTGDTTGISASQSAAIMRTVGAGTMILSHETVATTVNTVVPNTVPGLVAAGIQFVTVDKCLGTEAYQAVGSYGVRDSTWTCSGTPGPGL
jgi:peptidoglycan/xylan/chitin deacetylase (PgdA/CDA1 family)